ncbi:MAG: hypothetical protein KAT07_00785 [Calditrichia bacterium]|nr:hypothetical protein [Calditrichia bacterium]
MRQMIILLLTIILWLNCSSNIRLHQNLKKKEHVLAIVPFTGKGVNKNWCYSAADELTRLLFIEKNINVIDRSRINSALVELKIENPYYFSSEEMRTFSDTLDATIICLGRIYNHVQHKERNEPINHLSITLSFVDGRNTKVIGMIYDHIISSDSYDEIIPRILKKMVGKI